MTLLRSHIITLITVVICTFSFAHADLPPTTPYPTATPQVMFGAFTYGGVWQGMEPVYALEAKLQRRLDIVHWFMNWGHAWDPALVAQASLENRLPLISWQPHRKAIADIAAGHFDNYIRSWAHGARLHGGPIYLRPFPEMNGDWVPWNGEPAQLVMAWQRIVTLFHEEGATNVYWVWSPNVTDWPRTPENSMEAYYPGEAYVDVLALDGYNFGETRPHIGWRSYESVFDVGYQRITALGPQPVWIAEIASAERGGDKGSWIRNMFRSTAFPRVEAIVWFDEHKGPDWRIGSSEGALSALQESLAWLSP